MRSLRRSGAKLGLVRLWCVLGAAVFLCAAQSVFAQSSELPPLQGVAREPLPDGVCPLPCGLSAALGGGDFALLHDDYTYGGVPTISVYSPTPEGDYPWSIVQTIPVESLTSQLMAGGSDFFALGTSVYKKRRGVWAERQVLEPEGTPLAIASWGPLLVYLMQTEAGSEVFVYRERPWGKFSLETRLFVGESLAGSLAVSLGTIVVGAPEEDDGVGTASVFARGLRGWRLQQTLSPSASEAAAFGRALAVSGQWLAVGAPETGGYPAEGSFGEVYIYRRDRRGQFVESQKLTDPNPLPPDTMWSRQYGDHLAMHGPWLLISAKPGYMIDDPMFYLAHAEGGVWSTVVSQAFSYTYGVEDLDLTRDYGIAAISARRGSNDIGLFSLTALKRAIVSSGPGSPDSEEDPVEPEQPESEESLDTEP